MQHIVAHSNDEGDSFHGVVRQTTSFDLEIRERIARWLEHYMRERPHEFPTQIILARHLGLSGPTVNMILSRRRTPGLDVLIKMHRKFYISLDQLIDSDPPIPKDKTHDPQAAFSGNAAPRRQRQTGAK